MPPTVWAVRHGTMVNSGLRLLTMEWMMSPRRGEQVTRGETVIVSFCTDRTVLRTRHITTRPDGLINLARARWSRKRMRVLSEQPPGRRVGPTDSL
jgi:hypothetical protein